MLGRQAVEALRARVPRPATPALEVDCACGPECELDCVPDCPCQCEPPGFPLAPVGPHQAPRPTHNSHTNDGEATNHGASGSQATEVGASGGQANDDQVSCGVPGDLFSRATAHPEAGPAAAPADRDPKGTATADTGHAATGQDQDDAPRGDEPEGGPRTAPVDDTPQNAAPTPAHAPATGTPGKSTSTTAALMSDHGTPGDMRGGALPDGHPPGDCASAPICGAEAQSGEPLPAETAHRANRTTH